MSPPFDDPALSLILLNEQFVVQQLPVDHRIPDVLLNLITRNISQGSLVSVTRTEEEISIVCDNTSITPSDLSLWKCIKIKGPMDFGLTGIMCDFTTPLKAAGIPIFALSTWNTDYILVPEDKASDAVNVLKRDGWKFE
ncbi:hypothetical protein M0805_007036 [Coniferiporia weirii]|nr:hypothetical protein M0805_007036 [Coniferiporia weirii]